MKKLDYGYCKAAPLIEWMGDKWSLAVLMHLHENGTMRYNELFRTIPHISERMLASTLHTLERDGLVKREVFAEVPPRVEYHTTELAASLHPIIEQMREWGCKHFEEIMRNREKT